MLLVYSLMDGHWDCSCLLEILQTCFVSCGCVPRMELLGQGPSRNCQHVLQSSCPTFHHQTGFLSSPGPSSGCSHGHTHSASRSATLPRPVVFPRLRSHLLKRFSLLTDFHSGLPSLAPRQTQAQEASTVTIPVMANLQLHLRPQKAIQSPRHSTMDQYRARVMVTALDHTEPESEAYIDQH